MFRRYSRDHHADASLEEIGDQTTPRERLRPSDRVIAGSALGDKPSRDMGMENRVSP
jgi:hypothetical protein